MEALDIVKEVLTDKLIAGIELPIHSGPRGYLLILRLRLLLYGHLKGYLSTRKLRRHLKKHPEVLKQLGFKTLPNRRTIDRWKKRSYTRRCKRGNNISIKPQNKAEAKCQVFNFKRGIHQKKSSGVC